jgi:two-component system, cell cycle response regulator
LIADLDCFKGVNDNHGHDAGDEVLKKFAEALKSNTRASDICGRMGGDEFLLVITHVEDAHIRTTVERLREQFCSQKFSLGGKPFSVTVSVGVCGFQGAEPPEFSKLLKQADKALYSAKRAGRNQAKIEFL